MARPKASPEQREEQRSRLRQAAADIYNEEGIGAVTVRSVCKRAGVSTGTLYSYFSNLEALLQSFWIEAVDRANRRLDTIIAENPAPPSRVRALLQAYVDFAFTEPEVFRGAILFVRPASAPTPPTEPAEALPFYRLLRDAIEAGQSGGDFRAGDADTMAQVFWAGIHGALALPIHMDRYQVKPVGELAPAMVDALIATLSVE